MRRAVCFLVAGMCSLSPPLYAFQQAPPPRTLASWTDLTNEPSRAQLYKRFVVPAGLAAIASGPERGRPYALPASFTFPGDATYDTIAKKPRTDSIFGVDVSHYDPASLAFDRFRGQGIVFVYAKATQGTTFADPNFRTYWTALGSLSAPQWIPRGAYHFLSSDSPGADQADAFVAFVKLAGGFKANDLPPVVDLEWDVRPGVSDAWVGHSADDILTHVKDCLARIKALTGRTPMLYTATSWFGPDTIPLARFAEIGPYPVWIADYDPARQLSEKPSLPPGATATLWQFSDEAKTTADPDAVDASIFHGTAASFAAALGAAPPPFP